MTALYNLAGQYRELATQLEELDLDQATVSDTIEASGLLDDITTKAQGIEFIARGLELYSPAIEAEVERLTALKKQRETKAVALREYLKTQMEAAGISKIDCELFQISIAKNPPSVDVFAPELIPAQYMRHPIPPPPAPDKAAIAAALKANFDVQGARLIQKTKLKVK
ncbi:Siphovirus Gp157 [uncultured Caudovirales phage]|uniref:Siphovirus Gp157 n=1 Tax=uncultured Caudovirales phage TaxID=2100421 RepID=A0A6J5MYY7_9CAUD|nr:Siphovirus Gp157 [uncultured Caudovirales phage]